MPAITFSHPWYLLLLPLLIAGAVYVSRRSLADLRGSRARWSLGLRLGIVAAAVLALAGLQVSQPAKRLAVLFVLDESDSVPTLQKKQAIDWVNAAAQKMGPNDEGGVLVFGGDAYLEKEPTPTLSLKRVHTVPSRDYTNLSGAIRLAMAAFPDDTQRRIVVVSDGNENLGSAVQEAATAVSAGVQIDVVPVTYTYAKETLIEKMVVPSETKVGEPFEVRLIARSTTKTRGVLRLLRNGELIQQQNVDLLAGPNVITFNQSLEDSKFHTYEAILESKEDTLAENNRGLGFVLVKGKPRVLIVESNPQDARFLVNALQNQKLDVDVREPGRLPATLAEFQTYDSVVLSNVGAYQLTPDQMKAIRSSVRDLGAGLVMIGGENSYGPGAYRGTPIEEALPVEMEVKKSKVMPVGAVAMVLHTCEFPDGNRWARETAAAVVDVLGERDKVGVLLYGMGGEEWGIPMQLAANKEPLKAQLYNLDPGDMPDYHAIMQKAYEGLVNDAKEAAVKHIIVISDGDASPPSAELMARLRKAKVTVSTVAVFPHGGGTGTLEAMAQVGKGEFYNVKRPQEIPRIFLKEAQRVLKPAIIEETFVPRTLKGSQLLQGIDSTPPLMGYVATTAKQAPSVEVAMTSKRDDPILVSWRFGLGKAVAFMSDAKNRWAAPWVGDADHFGRFWAQTIRWTVRSTSRANVDAQVEINQRKGKVVVDVVDNQGNFVNELDIRGSVAATNVSPNLRVNQTAPGRYEGEFDAPEKGQYMIALHYTDKSGTPRTQLVGAAVPYSPEYRDLFANTAVLSSLADRTKGVVYPALGPQEHQENLQRVWRREKRTHTAPQDLWPALVLLAALLLPVDIGVRRLVVSRNEWAAMLGSVHAATLGRLTGRKSEQREEAMGTLLGAKARASQRMGTDAADAVAANAAQEAAAQESAAAAKAAATAAAQPSDAQRTAPAPRTMPRVQGARSMTPPPPSAPPAAAPAPRPDLERVQPDPAPVPPAASAPTTKPESRTEPKPEQKPDLKAAPATGGGVIWHKPVPGVTPTADSAPQQQKPAEKKTEAPTDDDSTSRLLRAKKRAKDKEE